MEKGESSRRAFLQRWHVSKELCMSEEASHTAGCGRECSRQREKQMQKPQRVGTMECLKTHIGVLNVAEAELERKGELQLMSSEIW